MTAALAVSASGCAQIHDGRVGGKLSGETVSQEDWDNTVQEVLPSVIKIDVSTCDGAGSGSGFFIPDWIVTNRHVLEDASEVEIRVGKTRYQPTEWFISETDDLALIPLGYLRGRPLILEEGDPQPGDLVAAAGYPWGGPKISNFGRITGIDEEKSDSSKTFAFQTNLDIHPGNSGGPMLDTSGKVIGVVFAIDLRESMSLVIPLSRLTANIAIKGKEMTERVVC